MSLADSSKAISAVTDLLVKRLGTPGPLPAAQAGRPDKITSTFSGVNLFLYEVERNAEMSNISLFDGEPPPLWLTLHYLLTAAQDGDSDIKEAHEYLGLAMAFLQNNSILTPTAGSPEAKALAASGESLKITFEPRASDIVSKVTHPGGSEHFRLSVAFQVRPIVIVPAAPQKFDLLVGIDYTQTPQKIIGLDGVGIDVLPSMGPKLTTVKPNQVTDADPDFLIEGEDLHLSGLECLLGGVNLTITEQKPDHIKVKAALAGKGLSAGELPLLVQHPLLNGRKRRSNLITLSVCPKVTGAAIDVPNSKLIVQGELLGGSLDDIWIALYLNGQVIRVYENPTTVATQQQLEVPLGAAFVTHGNALVIVRVNGLQAHLSPVVTV